MPFLYRESLATPIGNVEIITDDKERVVSIDFEQPLESASYPPRPSASSAMRALVWYFNGALDVLQEDFTFAPCGTSFQNTIWRALQEIPAGQTISYAELARRAGKPRAARAAGLANGANPFPILIPCHRVIRADGGLGGYSSGVERKRWLLRHEGVEFDGNDILRSKSNPSKQS